MKILDRYLARQFLWPFCFSLLCFLFLYWLIDLFTHLDDFLKNQVPLGILFQYYLATIPIVLVQTSPLASITGAVSSLSRLNRTHELMAMRSCGLSWYRISSPLLVIGLVITFSALFLNDRLIPQAMMVTHAIKKEHLERAPQETYTTVIENVALYGTKNRMFYAKRYDPNEKILYDLIVFIDDASHRPAAKIAAEKAEWIVNDKWKLYSCVSYQLGHEGEIIDKPTYYEERTMDLDETPQSFLKMESQILFMRYAQLEDYIDRIAVSGKNVTRRLLVELYSRVAFPFANFALILAAISLAISPPKRQGWFFSGIGLCVFIGILFYLLNSVMISLGKAGILPPFIGAWGANFIFSVLGVFFLRGQLK